MGLVEDCVVVDVGIDDCFGGDVRFVFFVFFDCCFVLVEVVECGVVLYLLGFEVVVWYWVLYGDDVFVCVFEGVDDGL